MTLFEAVLYGVSIGLPAGIIFDRVVIQPTIDRRNRVLRSRLPSWRRPRER